MTRVEQMVWTGQQFLSQNPESSDDRLREYLQKEFLVNRNSQVSLLRSRLWFLALLSQLFGRSEDKTVSLIRDQIDEAILILRATPEPQQDPIS